MANRLNEGQNGTTNISKPQIKKTAAGQNLIEKMNNNDDAGRNINQKSRIPIQTKTLDSHANANTTSSISEQRHPDINGIHRGRQHSDTKHGGNGQPKEAPSSKIGRAGVKEVTTKMRDKSVTISDMDSEELCAVLDSCVPEIMTNIQLNIDVYTEMFHKKLLTSKMIRSVQHEQTVPAKVSLLMRCIKEKLREDKHTYLTFCEVLEKTNQKQLSDALLHACGIVTGKSKETTSPDVQKSTHARAPVKRPGLNAAQYSAILRDVRPMLDETLVLDSRLYAELLSHHVFDQDMVTTIRVQPTFSAKIDEFIQLLNKRLMDDLSVFEDLCAVLTLTSQGPLTKLLRQKARLKHDSMN